MDTITLKASILAITTDPDDPEAAVDDLVAAIETFVQSAIVTVTVNPADIGLQTSTTAGLPTGGPAGAKTLTGSLS